MSCGRATPVMLSSVSPSQQDSNVPTGFPGGDPSLLIMPPLEQFRNSYVFLTPDKYSFDFIRIMAPRAAVVVLDGRSVDEIDGCTAHDADGISEGKRPGSHVGRVLAKAVAGDERGKERSAIWE